MIYGMHKTTLYIPDDIREELRRASRDSGRSEAELIRAGIRLVLERCTRPRPSSGIFDSADPSSSERVDELLEGFGQE